MGARNFSLAQYGTINEQTATGVFAGAVDRDYEANKVDLKNHIDDTVGFVLSDDKINISISGAVVSRTVGMVPAIASVLTLAETTANSLNLNTKHTYTTPVANAGIVVTGMKLSRANSEFETGDITSVFHPGVTTNAPVSLT